MFENFRFRKHVQVKSGGSVTLGFLDVDVVTHDMVLTIQDLTVRLTQDGRPSLSAPNRPYTDKRGQKRYRSAYRFDDASYSRLLKQVFELGVIDRAVEDAIEQDKELERVRAA